MPDVGGFSDPAFPTDRVMVEPFNGAGPTSRNWWDPRTWRTEGWILEKRSFNEFNREEVPARARRNVEAVATGRTREASAAGKCWTECEYIPRTTLQRYYVVSRHVEWWRVNTTLEGYYNWVTGAVPGVGGMGITAATANQGGRNIMQVAARETVKGLIGSTFPEAVPTLGAAAPGAITASTALVAVGVGVTFFVGSTYLVRGWIEDAVMISSTWELDVERSGFGPPEQPTEGTPYWRTCSEVRDCPDSKTDKTEGHGMVPGTGLQPGGKSSPAAVAFHRWGWPLGGLLLLVLFFATRAVIGGDGDQPVPLVATAVGSETLSSTPTATNSTVPATATAPTVAPTLGVVTGKYAGTVTVTTDPAGHRCCVIPSNEWDVLQVRNTQTQAIAITLSSVLPGITLTGSVPSIGQQFTASGSGTVAGYAGVSAEFTGVATAEGGVNGSLLVGANGALPQRAPITFTVTLQRRQ